MLSNSYVLSHLILLATLFIDEETKAQGSLVTLQSHKGSKDWTLKQYDSWADSFNY